jgi:hypothetical protein
MASQGHAPEGVPTEHQCSPSRQRRTFIPYTGQAASLEATIPLGDLLFHPVSRAPFGNRFIRWSLLVWGYSQSIDWGPRC